MHCPGRRDAAEVEAERRGSLSVEDALSDGARERGELHGRSDTNAELGGRASKVMGVSKDGVETMMMRLSFLRYLWMNVFFFTRG